MGAAGGIAGGLAAEGGANYGAILDRATEVVAECEVEGQMIGEVAENDADVVLDAAINVIDNLHHSVPKFLGGYANQMLSKIPSIIHQDLHFEIAEQLSARGINMNIGGIGGITADWARFLQNNPGMQGSAFNGILEATMNVDAMYGTSITEDALSNLIGGCYTAY